MPTPTELFFAIVFCIVGMGYMAYGRKNNFWFMLCGLTLLVITFFSFDIVTYVICGVVLIIAPFVLSFFT